MMTKKYYLKYLITFISYIVLFNVDSFVVKYEKTELSAGHNIWFVRPKIKFIFLKKNFYDEYSSQTPPPPSSVCLSHTLMLCVYE